ncbi:hypothetical protein QYM36_002824, partial [Artemia franciscana]
DTQHSTSIVKTLNCRPTICTANHINTIEEVKPIKIGDAVLDDAKKYIDELYDFIEKFGSSEHLNHWSEIKTQIKESDGYIMKTKELQYVWAGDGEAHFFDIPEDLVRQVLLRHPKYENFTDLGNKWLTLQGLPYLKLYCGGLEFNAIPFSGWYSDSEIVSRDLGDKHIFKHAPVMASIMGLNTETNESNWRDLAVSELVVATFIEHIKSEYEERGGCPRDWVWVNPPGPFTTPVYHQQFKDQRNLVNSTRRKKKRNFYGEEFKKNASNPKATWKIINEVIRGSPAPQQYSLNVGGEIVRDLDKVCDLFAYHFSKIGETVQSEAAVNNELLIEESTFEDLRGQDFEMKLEP